MTMGWVSVAQYAFEALPSQFSKHAGKHKTFSVARCVVNQNKPSQLSQFEFSIVRVLSHCAIHRWPPEDCCTYDLVFVLDFKAKVWAQALDGLQIVMALNKYSDISQTTCLYP